MAVSKPLPGALIDRTAPVAQSLKAFWPFNEGGGRRYNDALDNANGFVSGTVVRNAQGAIFSGAGSIRTPVGKLAVTKTTKFSIVVRCAYTSTGYSSLFTNWNNASGGYALLTWAPLGGALGLFIGGTSSSNYIGGISPAYNDGKIHTFGFDYDGSVTAGGITTYVDGKKVTATPTTAGTGDPGAFADYGVWIGERNDGSVGGFAGSVEYAGMWIGGNLGAAGHAAIAQNPWALWPDEPQLVFAPASGTIIAVDGCSVGTSLDSSYLASYFAAQAISNAMASASSVQSSTAGVNAQGVSQASWNGLSASINGVDGASVAASASSVQTATILVLDANGSAVSCAISSVITQDVMVLAADGATNGQALFQVNFSATAGVDGEAVGQATGIGEQSAIVNVSGSASATSAASAGAAIVLSSDGASESSSVAVAPGIGIFGADGAAGSAVGYATSSVDVQSIGAVSGAAIGHVAGDTFSGATATVSGTSRAHSVVTGQLARVIGKVGRDVAVAVARAPKAIVLAKDARSESNSVAKAGRAGIGAATGRSESQSIARGDATTTVTANYPVSIDMTTVPPDSWMVLVPLETTTAAVSVYGDDATVPQEVTTVTVQSDDAIPVPVDTWKATA